MIRFYEFDDEGRILPAIHPVNHAFHSLLGQGETINEAIERAIDRLPPEQNGVVFTVTGNAKGDVHLAAALRFREDWTVNLGADFPKGEAAQYRIEIAWKG